MKKILCVLLAVLLVSCSFALPSFAAQKKTSVAVVIPEKCEDTVSYAAAAAETVRP